MLVIKYSSKVNIYCRYIYIYVKIIPSTANEKLEKRSTDITNLVGVEDSNIFFTTGWLSLYMKNINKQVNVIKNDPNNSPVAAPTINKSNMLILSYIIR